MRQRCPMPGEVMPASVALFAVWVHHAGAPLEWRRLDPIEMLLRVARAECAAIRGGLRAPH